MKTEQSHLSSSSQLLVQPKDCTNPIFDKVLSTLMIITISPLMVINVLFSLLSRHSLFCHFYKVDALGHLVVIHHFNSGIFRNSALLIDILMGELSFCGVPFTHRLPKTVQANINRRYNAKPGLFSLFDLHQRTGLVVNNPEELLLKQLNLNAFENVLLLLKSLVCSCLYSRSSKTLIDTKKFSVFGLNLNNSSMKEAVDWATVGVDNSSLDNLALDNVKTPTNIGFFINVNSINICLNQTDFHHTLQQADMLLADGSGMRLAAKSAGYLLKDNTNGTDMLPHLCRRCIEQSKSLYFLGSKPDVAAKAALNLQKQFPELVIAGTQHGFIEPSQFQEQIKKINGSGCDILLVAMGSPFQETWLLEHREQLHCQTALAVGGLFDFYSGDISRSPLWIRELGFEWVWRLLQEPMTKFKRYVIGNPLFLFRIYVLGLASKGVK